MIEPSYQARMLATPVFAETEIAVAESAGKRDLSDIGQGLRRCVEGRRSGFESGESASDFAGLMIKHFCS